MHIIGHKPSGFSLSADGEGKRIDGETRQCVHCQYTWQYRPGSGARRGFCLHCYGLICGRAECFAQQKTMLAAYPEHNCMAYNDYINRELERFAKECGYELTAAGILIPRGMRVEQPKLEETMAIADPQARHTGSGWNS